MVLWAYYSLLGLAALVAFGWCRFPDLTPDAAVVIGPAAFAAAIAVDEMPVIVALVVGFVAGGLCGVTTALLNSVAKIPGFVASMVTAIASFTVFFEVQGDAKIMLDASDILFHGWSGDMSTHDAAKLEFALESVLCVILAGVTIAFLASTWWGIRFRCVGDNHHLATPLAFPVWAQRLCGLFLANGSAGLAGCLLLSLMGFHSAPMFVTLYAVLTMSFGAGVWGHRLRASAALTVPLTGGFLVALVHHVAIHAIDAPAHWLQGALAVVSIIAFVLLRMRSEEGVIARVKFDR